MGKPRRNLTSKFRFWARKTRRDAGEKIKGSNNAFLSPISLLRDLALSNDLLVAWGIRLPIQDNVCTTGKPVALKNNLFQRNYPQ